MAAPGLPRDTLGLTGSADGVCPPARVIIDGLERQRQEAQRLRGLLQTQTQALLAQRAVAVPQPGAEPLDPVSERTAATVSIATATMEHMLQFVDLAMLKLQTQDEWWRTQLEKAGAQSGGLTAYVSQMADESEELLKAATPRREHQRTSTNTGTTRRTRISMTQAKSTPPRSCAGYVAAAVATTGTSYPCRGQISTLHFGTC